MIAGNRLHHAGTGLLILAICAGSFRLTEVPAFAAPRAPIRSESHNTGITALDYYACDGCGAMNGIPEVIFDTIYFDPTKCKPMGYGTLDVVVPPQLGTITQKKESRYDSQGRCPAQKFPATVVYYTRTASGDEIDPFYFESNSRDDTAGGDFNMLVAPVVTSGAWYVVGGKLSKKTLNQWMMETGATAGEAALTSAFTPAFIFDFGDPVVSDGIYGATGYLKIGFLNVDQIEQAVSSFAEGYSIASGGLDAVLVVGTNNHFNKTYTSDMIAAHGEAWAELVAAIDTQLSGYPQAVGGIDAELKWSSSALAEQWIQGFRNAGGSLWLADFGDANGCHTSGATATPSACYPGWNQDDVLYAALGGFDLSHSLPFPEIYSTAGGNAKQWQQILLYAHLAYGIDAQYLLAGPLTQFGACSQEKPGKCEGIDNTPQQAWQQLNQYLGRDSRTASPLLNSIDISRRR